MKLLQISIIALENPDNWQKKAITYYFQKLQSEIHLKGKLYFNH
jgi:hypothetical protein